MSLNFIQKRFFTYFNAIHHLIVYIQWINFVLSLWYMLSSGYKCWVFFQLSQEKKRKFCFHCLINSKDAQNEICYMYHGNNKIFYHNYIFNNYKYIKHNWFVKQRWIVILFSIKTFNNKAVIADHLEMIEKFNSKLDKLEYCVYDLLIQMNFNIRTNQIEDLNKCKQYWLLREKSIDLIFLLYQVKIMI